MKLLLVHPVNAEMEAAMSILSFDWVSQLRRLAMIERQLFARKY